MKRVLIAALAFASVSFGKEWKPSEAEISAHREEIFALARDYIVETFNLQLEDEGTFNPVRFDSRGVWGNFEARIKELGDDRYEVQGWMSPIGHDVGHIRWTVHLRYRLDDPEAWRYSRIDEVVISDPEYLGWKFGKYRSIGYEADYDPAYIAAIYPKKK